MYSIKDLTAKLNISIRTIYRLIADGELTPTYIRSSPRFNEKEVESYIKKRTLKK